MHVIRLPLCCKQLTSDSLAWSIKDLCKLSACLCAASSLLPTVCWTVGGQVVLRLSLGGVYTHPLQPPTFSSCTTGPTVGPRVRDEKLHPIPMSLAPRKDEKIWVLGRGPHAAIEMRKENPRRNDTGREGEVLVQPNPTLTETGSEVEFQHR
jgi:hypothetical protein